MLGTNLDVNLGYLDSLKNPVLPGKRWGYLFLETPVAVHTLWLGSECLCLPFLKPFFSNGGSCRNKTRLARSLQTVERLWGYDMPTREAQKQTDGWTLNAVQMTPEKESDETY